MLEVEPLISVSVNGRNDNEGVAGAASDTFARWLHRPCPVELPSTGRIVLPRDIPFLFVTMKRLRRSIGVQGSIARRVRVPVWEARQQVRARCNHHYPGRTYVDPPAASGIDCRITLHLAAVWP